MVVTTQMQFTKAALIQPGQSMYMLSNVSIYCIQIWHTLLPLIVILSFAICFITSASNRACIEDPHVAQSCSRNSGGCSYPFHGITVCYDDKYSKWHN